MPNRLTKPHEALGDDAEAGYAEYGCDEDAPDKAATPRPKAHVDGHAGAHGQQDHVGSARRSTRRSDQRYYDSADDQP